jgi:hypothetical protein
MTEDKTRAFRKEPLEKQEANQGEYIDPKLAQALLEAQKKITHAVKNAENPHFKSAYATLEATIEAVKKPLNNNGITFLQVPYHVPGYQCVETVFILAENGAVFRAGKTSVACKDQTPQSYGSSLTYARRYSLGTSCVLKTEKDDDANKAQSSNNTTRPSDNKGLM